MAQVLSFPLKEPEQEIIYFEMLPEGDSGPLIKMKGFGDNGVVESEVTVMVIS